MRVTLVTHSIDNGGSAQSLYLLARHLAARHELTLVSFLPPDPERAMAARYAALGIPVAVCPHPSAALAYVGCGAPPEATMREGAPPPRLEKTDAAVFNGWPATALASAFPDARRVLIAREVVLEERPGAKALMAATLAGMDAAIAIGPVEAAQLARAGRRAEIIHNSPARTPALAPFPPGPARFGVFAELRPQKGLDVLLNAWASQADALRAAGAKLFVFGVDPRQTGHPLLRQVLDFLAAARLEESVRLMGWTDDAPAQMAALHAVVRPDRTGHPWGRDVIEAFSLGRPVIAAGEKAVFVRPGQTGWLVPAGDEGALGRTLAALAAQPQLLRRAGRAALAFAREHFDPEKNHAALEAIIVGEGGTP